MNQPYVIGDVLADNQAIDLTQHEIRALKMRFNLADAHTHQGQSPSQRKIVSALPDLWYEAERSRQADLEQAFIEAFFRLHGQPTALAKKNKVLLSYAASISTMVAAMYLNRHHMSVTLIEPCFDNLHDVLANMGVPLYPIDESVFADVDQIYDNLHTQIETDALFLVDPNNPTGSSLLQHGRKGFEEVVRFCRDHNKVLLVDFCFASFNLFGEHGRFDVYELLEDSGITYLVIEDTGKTWPVQDAKCAMLVPSDDIYCDVYNLHTSVLLNVSPFVLNMLRHYIEDSIGDRMASVLDLLDRNRAAMVKALDGSVLRYQEPFANTSVAWFRIDHPTLTATEVQSAAARSDVYVLPGKFFYWSQPSKGEQFVRIALARDSDMFEAAMARLRAELDSHVS